VVAAAFHPLTPSQYLVPDEKQRRGIFPDYFALYLKLGIYRGMVLTTATREACAITLPVNIYDNAGVPELDGYDQRLREITGPWYPRFAAFDAALHTAHPLFRHDFLAILAVAPAVQGNGYGTALMSAYQRLLAGQAPPLPSYLEAAPGLTRYYTHLGYRSAGPPIDVADGATALDPMVWYPPANPDPPDRDSAFADGMAAYQDLVGDGGPHAVSAAPPGSPLTYHDSTGG
jgi:GNAT superfamily N-acetyltransferase